MKPAARVSGAAAPRIRRGRKDLGRDMGLRSRSYLPLTALAAMLVAAPAHAQDTGNQANTATPTPTPTPGVVGAPELQNFNLGGTVTRRADPPAAPAPAAPAQRVEAPPRAPAPTNRAQATVERPPASAPAPTRDTAPSTTSVELPAPAIVPPEVVSGTTQTDLMPPPPAETPSAPLWPWLVALVAAGAAAAWLRSRRRSRDGALAYAGHDAAPPAGSVPQTAPIPRTPVPPPSKRAPVTADGGIVSRSLHPRLAFELVPIKLETDDKRNVRLTFDLVVTNVGSAPARDVRVEAKMFNAGPNQDVEIGQFFRSPGALGAKLPVVAPQDKLPLRSRVGMTAESYSPLQIEGRSLAVPMLAVNALYRGPAGEDQQSASWLVGRMPPGAAENSKLAPFALDRAHGWDGLEARVHSQGIAR